MKLAEQKTLLADVRAVTDDALKILNSGVKIGSIVQRLRAAGDELEARVRYLEKNAPQKKAAKPAKTETSKAPEKPE